MLEIKSPITGEKLVVAESDFENRMDWYQAKSACNELGNGWRLPTKSELKLMFKLLDPNGKGKFKNSEYWSNTEGVNNYAWTINFKFGMEWSYNKSNEYYVRAVRAL
jgi:hypothetical protein